MTAAERVIEVKDLSWQWDAEGPHVRLVGPTGDWPQHVKLDPAPGYAHSIELVRAMLEQVERAFPIEHPPLIYLLDHDDVGRTNGQTRTCNDYSVKDEHGRHPTRHFIVLYGKRIPSHPAVTRYLVAHEYGHVVEDVLGAKLYKGNEPDRELLKAYAEVRGLKAPNYYGPGTWHATPGEVFANDFRIIVCGVEPEFWPHPGIAHPNDCPAAKSWWSTFAPKAAT